MVHLILLVFCLGKSHAQRVVNYLLTKLEINQDKVKVGTLEVFKHMMNSCGIYNYKLTSRYVFSIDVELEDKKPLIVSGMKILLNQQSLKVYRFIFLITHA